MITTIYNKNKAFFLFLLLWGAFLQNAQGQAFDYTLSITEPGSIAGDYDAALAGFGATYCDVESLTGELLIVEDGMGGTAACDTIVNDLTGKIALIDRGACGFVIKVKEAQDRGAIGVMVCNNVSDPIIIMGGADPEITIPSFMVSLADCNAIRLEVPNGVTVTFSQTFPLPQYPAEETVVWGDNPGEGDFDGGLNGWTVNHLSCGAGVPIEDFELWRWEEAGNAPNGGCGGSQIFSPTKCNGAMVFESDFYDTNGEGCGGAAAGSGPCPASQVGELISPEIDLSGSTADAYSLRFYQETRQFQSTYWVGWSTDNGVTWDSTEVNTDIDVNDSNTDDQAIVSVPLTGVPTGAPSLRVKIRYEANYYYWIVDDVQIIEQEANNLRVNSNFFAVPTSYVTPLDQVEPIRFLADIENVGAATQTNVVLTVTIEDEGGNVVFTADNPYNEVPGNTLVENIPFDDTFTPTAVGQYFGRYEISADQEDADTTNNFREFDFFVSDTTYAKEVGRTTGISPAASNWDDGEAHGAAYGNYFYITNGAGNFIRSVSFSIDNAPDLAGNFLQISLYKWNEDTNENDAADPEEREFVDFQFYVIEGTEMPGDIITVPFPEDTSMPIELEDNTGYLLMLEWFPPTEDPTLDFLVSWSDLVDYGAAILVNELQGTPRYAPMVGLNDDLFSEPYGTVGFGRNRVPVVRMNVGADPTSARDVQRLRQQFVLFPNPTSDQLFLRLFLEDPVQRASVRIFDMSGRMILQRELDNAQWDAMNFDVQGWAPGTYMLQLVTDQGAGTRRFVISR